jgi:hypothetical protein
MPSIFLIGACAVRSGHADADYNDLLHQRSFGNGEGQVCEKCGFFRKAWTEGNEDISDGAATEQLATDDINVRRSGASARHEQECGQKTFTETMHSRSNKQPSASLYDYAVE